MLTFYDYLPSQNAYKVRLLLSHLDTPHRTEYVSIFEGHGQKPEYRAVNPTGAVPAIRFDDGRVLAESTAILFYLAERTPYLPAHRFLRARVIQWLSFENDYLQNSIGSLRYWTLTGKLESFSPHLIESKRRTALKVLRILDESLADAPFLVDNRYTIADMACFAYTHLAEDAGLALREYGNVVEWIKRVREQAGFLAKVHLYSIDPHSAKGLP